MRHQNYIARVLSKGIVCPKFLSPTKTDGPIRIIPPSPQNDKIEQYVSKIVIDKYTTVHSKSKRCDSGWAPVAFNKGNYCYFFNLTKTTRHEAAITCGRMNATLPLPSSADDDTLLRSLFRKTTARTSIQNLPSFMIPGSSTGLWIDAMLIGIGRI